MDDEWYGNFNVETEGDYEFQVMLDPILTLKSDFDGDDTFDSAQENDPSIWIITVQCI